MRWRIWVCGAYEIMYSSYFVRDGSGNIVR